MNSRLSLCILLLAFGASIPAFAQDAEVEADPMAAWAAAGAPGAQHAYFAKKAGEWHIATKMWMEPGAPAMESESIATAEMVLGGRFLQEKVVGTTMGMPYEGLGMLGYDNTTGIVSALWWDSMSTMTAVMTGPWETIGEPLALTGSYVDAVSGATVATRTVTTFVSDDEQFFEYFMTMPGAPEVKVMEMVYTRVR